MLTGAKLKIIVRGVKIKVQRGEDLEEILESYENLTEEEKQQIREMSDYLLQMIEVQASVITDLTEVNKRLLLELEQYRAIEEEDNIILTMMQDIEEGKEDLIKMSSV